VCVRVGVGVRACVCVCARVCVFVCLCAIRCKLLVEKERSRNMFREQNSEVGSIQKKAKSMRTFSLQIWINSSLSY